MTEPADRLDVVAVAPHPDDLEITSGGTLALLVRQGYRVGMIDLTTGEPTPRGSEEVGAARFYAQLTKWDDRFGGTPPYRVPHLVYAPFPFDAEARPWHSTFVIDVSDTFEQKLEAVACYQSQFDQ